jgi:hypothetical protein
MSQLNRWKEPTMSTTTTATEPTTERKRRRVFMWSFILVQLLFVAWLIAGIATTAHGASTCTDPALTHAECASAAEVGGTIGVGLVIGLWVALDVILGIGRLVVITARRHGAK